MKMAQLLVLRQLSLSRKNMTTPLFQQLLKFSRHHRACLEQRKTIEPAEGESAIQTSSSTSRSEISTDVSLGEKIKENTKTASYTAIILAGIGVTGIMLYAIFRELFSASSPNNVYSDALDRVKEDPRVQDAIGAPIKGFGEESRRGRRQHVAHKMFDRNGVPHMRMQFYVQGIRNKATVHLESRKNPAGKMEFRYLFVQLDHYPRTTIILEDNRAFDPVPQQQPALNSSNLELTSFSDEK